MKAKRFILMLLVMLGSVTGAWAVVAQMGYSTLETEFTQTMHGNYTNMYDYTCNSNQGTMVLRTNSAILLNKIEVFVWRSWSETSPNSIKIEGSNDKSEWITLADQDLLYQYDSSRYVTVSSTEFYQYFRLTLYGSSSSIVIRDIYLYEEKFAGEGTSQDPYILDKTTYLQQFAALVAGGNNTVCAKLTTNLDLNGMTLASIDNASYTGTIDGDGHTIKNLNNANGLFKNIGAATIKKLTLENATLSATDENSGAFAAQANGTNFQNCTVKGTISASSTNTGGLVGNALGCTFTDCQINGLNITGTNVGGLAGTADNRTSFTNCTVSSFISNDAETAGGLVGNATGTTFTNCNVSNFTSNDAVTAGGLVGNANGATFTTCLVLLDITAVDCTTLGGLAGVATNNTTFTKCYSVGNFSVEGTNCGGLVGVASNNTQLTQCYSVTNMDEIEIRPTYEDGSPVPNNNTTPPNLLVDEAGTSTKWCDHVTNGGLYIIVSTGGACKLQSIKLWNGGDTQSQPGRRWKDVKVYGSLSAEGPWDENALIKSFTNLELAANNNDLAGELSVNSTKEYKYYKIEVLSTMGQSLQQMSDMKFVITSRLLHLPVCGSSDGSCTATHCYHYGSTPSALSTSVEKADVASGRLAYLLNGSVDFAITGPYYQKLGTDMYPVLTGTNYVYRSRDGNSYTNTCPHNNPTIVAAYKPLTCIADGNAAYYQCQNPVCKLYCYENGTQITPKEAILSSKPVIVKNHSWTTFDYPGLGYKDNIYIDGTTYYNVTTLYTNEHIYLTGDYIVTYTNFSDESTMRFYEFFRLDGNWSVTQNIRYYVNGVERTELSHTLGFINYKEIVVDNLKKHDIVKIVYGYNSSENHSGTVQLYIAQYKPTGWSGEHSFVTKPADFNCVEGGYDEHCECELCGNAYSSNSHNTTDEDLVSLSNFWLEPNAASHTYALSNQTTDEGLLKYTCQNTNCKAHDPSHFMIPNCVGTTGVEVTTDGDTYSAVESKITVEDGNRYNSPVPFSIGSLEYQRTFFTNVWNPWFVPFDMTVSELSDKGVTVVACIESIHNYDTDMDGVVDKTVLEVILKKDGTLKANVPYMVKTGNSYTYPMNFTDMVLNASTDTKTVHTETGSAAYDFIGTYSGLTADEVNAASIFSLNSVGAMVHRTGEILPQRWYMKEVGKENVYEELSPAMARAISIRVIGEEDETTGIRTVYTEDRQTEELLPNGIFDLSGRKLSTPRSGQINIINGKKQFVK